MRKFGFWFSVSVYFFISTCTICTMTFAADSKTVAVALSEDILAQFKNPDMTHRPGGRYDGVYAKDKIAEQLVADEVEITSESSMGNLEMASGDISTMRAVFEAANKYGISVMVKPNKNDNYSQGLHHALVENTTGLAKGEKIVGTNLMTGSLIKPALQMVLAVRYTLDGNGRKVQQEVVDLGTGDFTFSYVEGETTSSGRGGFPGGGGFPPQGGMPEGTGGDAGAAGPGMGGASQGGMPGGSDEGRGGLPQGGMPDGTGGTGGPGGEGGIGGPGGGPGGPGSAATRNDTVTVTYNGNGVKLDTGRKGEWDIFAFYTGYDPDQGMLDHPDYYSKEGLAIIKAAILGSFGLDENAEPTTEGASAVKAAMRENAKYSQAIIASDGGDFNQTLSDCAWSSGLVAKIRELYGYDFIEYLPIQYCGFTSGSDLTDQQIQNDWKEAFSYLCADYFRALDSWAKDIWGAGFRAQIGFAGELDTGILTPALSTPDTESYWPSSGAYDNNYDVTTAYTQVTSGSHILRRRVTSNVELGANKGVHSTPYVDFLLKNANMALYGGVNNMIYHVYSSQVGGSFGTPGGVGPYAVWTYVEPQWSAIDDFNGHIARAQYIMQTGTAQRDLALYYHVYDTSGSDYVSYAVDDRIEAAGYTYDIVNPGYMEQENFYAEEGVIDPTGGRYKALVVYHPLTLDKDVETRVWNNWNFGYSWDESEWESKMEGQFIPLETAHQFLECAKKGVPVIVVGDYNTFYDMNLDRAKRGNTGTDELRAIFKQIDAMGKLYTAKTLSDVTGTLQKAGIQPDVRKDTGSRIVSWKQNFSTTDIGVEGATETSNADFYWLFNFPCGDPEKEFVDKDWNMAYDEGETITQTLYFKGEGTPFKADLWSGEVTPVANYEVTDDGYIAIEVTLEAYDTALYGIVHDGKNNVHAADLNSDCFYRYDKNGNLYLCAFKGGKYTVKLGSGKTKTVTAANAAPPINLTNWDLSIESWTSNFGYSRSDVMDALGEGVQKDMLETVKVSNLGTQTWNTFGTFTLEETGKKVAAESVSGVGYYTATFDIGGSADGAVLSIGKVYDTVQLWVNGRKVGINMNTLDVDISDYLVKGRNTVKIAVASDLQNVCVYNDGYTSSFQDQDGKVESLQAYGMGGPVTVTPYVKVAVK